MSKVVQEEIDNLNAVLTVTVEKGDYEPKLKSELNRFRQKASIKGFRKGKTPDSVVRKLYGKGILSEIVYDLLQKELNDYLYNGKIDILGQPLPSLDQAPIDFDLLQLQDYIFKFDIGLAPVFDVQGLDSSVTYKKYDPIIPAEDIDQEIDNIQRQLGERIFSEDVILAGDMLKVEASELEDGKIKEDGHVHTFSLLVDALNDDIRDKVLTLKVHESFQADPFKLEKDRDEKFVRKYILGLTDEQEVGQLFDMKIIEATRVNLAEMNQELFDKAFGEDQVHSEEEAREFIEKGLKFNLENQADALLFRDIQKDLIEKNHQPLPDAFLKRWLMNSNENLAPESIEEGYPAFAENLQWSMIRGKIVRENELEVTNEEIKGYFKDRFRSYLGGANFDDTILDSVAERMMGEEKQVNEAYENLMFDRLSRVVISKITVENNPISLADFQAVVRQVEQEAKASRAAGINLLEGEEE
jgi:trigger factor